MAGNEMIPYSVFTIVKNVPWVGYDNIKGNCKLNNYLDQYDTCNETHSCGNFRCRSGFKF